MSAKIVARLAAAAIVALSVVSPASAANYKSEYKLSTVLGDAFPWGQGGQRWADLIAEKTEGRINVKMYPGTSLVGGDQTKEFTALRQGMIDMAVGSTINWSPQVRELNLFALPFLMPDYKAIDALTQGEVGKDLFDILAQRDVVPLAWGENGFRQLSNSKREVRTPEDLKGLKVRVVGSPLFIDTMTALGANPVQMSWADAQPAMATGAVDGQENPLSIFIAAKLNTVSQNYLTLWDYVADPLIFVVNKRVWDSWSEEDRQAVREAAEQAAAEQIQLARQGIAGEDTAALQQISSQGVTVTQLSIEEKEAFQKATQEVFAKWSKTIGEDLVKKAQDSIANR
ncbi:DctP family TRAP transporter solute-binding subunit [Telmatospirillum sp. J64-1]|uniref:DctP family TRAP transporter solute-binding subunit n=1 Tax=Telmatospirillum sp. J64-1 TaxID=2502183 RepID=UPI00115F5981|nr:DctP family TRAP transporter solute-binding subunit [Telmatospirillum sp. J64-1]